MLMKHLVLSAGYLQASRGESLPVYEPWAAGFATNFSVIDPAMWTTDTGCTSCKAPKDPKTKFQCTNMTASALRPGSIASGAGLTIVTTRQSNAGACTPAAAGGTSGHLSSKQSFSFGTIRVKAKYFPGSASHASTMKGFIGLEDPHSGAITLTMHGIGGDASGAPAHVDWTRYMQSSCYQHGNDHDKTFSDLGDGVSVADDFNVYEIDWTPTKVTCKVNGRVAWKVSGAANIPQKPLYVRLHARSTEYNGMKEGAVMEHFIQEFSFEPSKPTPAPTPSPGPTPGDTMAPGDSLESGDHLVAANGVARLEMQADGNLVLHDSSGPIWSTQTSGHPGAKLNFQGSDGNLVLRGDGKALWRSGAHSGAAAVVLQSDCNLVSRDASGKILWSTGTGCSSESLAAVV